MWQFLITESHLPKLARMSDADAGLATGGEGPWTWLSRYWGPVEVGPGPVQDEWAPRIEFRLARARHTGALDVGAVQSFLLGRRPSAEAAALALRIPAADRERFARAYQATTMAQQSNALSADPTRTREAQQLLLRANRLNPVDWVTSMTLAEMIMASIQVTMPEGAARVAALDRMLEIRPDYAAALRERWLIEARSGRTATANGYLERLRRVSPLDRALTGGEAPR